MEFIDEYRKLAEFVYFLTGPVLVLGLIIAAFQLKFIHTEARNRFERETIQLSLISLEKKNKSINALQHKLWETENDAEAKDFTGKVASHCKSGIVGDDEWVKQMEEDASNDVYNASIALLNEIESLSHYIYSGITDEDLCFQLEGETIITYIEDNLHYLAFHRNSEMDAIYIGTSKLYSDWSQKKKNKNLLSERKKLDSELNSLPKAKPIKVIGR